MDDAVPAGQAGHADPATALRDSEQRLLAVQRAAGVGDWSWDTVARCMRWSAQMFVLFERDPAAGPPRDPAAHSLLYPVAGERLRQAAIARIEDGQPGTSVDLEVDLPSGRHAWFRCTIGSDRGADDVLLRIWGTVQDVSAEYLQVLALEERHRDLMRINEQLEQFAYIASHDLLEPLRKVRFFADVVQSEQPVAPGSVAADAMSRMLRATDRMHRLVNDLLAFARAGKALTARASVAMAAVIAEAMDALDAQLSAAGGSVSCTDLPQVMGDRSLLVQVFQNLISNSLRYRHPGRTPCVWIQGATEGGEAVVSVSDNGLGFEAAEAQRLFHPFVRLHPGASGEGTGIGLAICRRIVEAHAGSIEAVPLAEGGACFTIRLPMPPEGCHAP